MSSFNSRPPNGFPRNPDQPSQRGSMTSSTRGLATPQMNPPRSQSPSSSPGMSRAERFEDEKRRIVESCFSKLDQNGQLAESYITHIRILEDAQYPSAPPPPESPESNKKPRLIIIAVRSTGRVRMHKARENNNGSFSIGKTWNMEELSAIESYASSAPPRDEREANYRKWAGDTGFTATISKPYYWQAGTPKEKDFFIASAVKIYRKYTKGQVPELKGFDDRDKIAILGGMAATPPAPGPGAPPGGSRQPSQPPMPPPPQPPFAHREQSHEGSRYRQSPGPPPSISDARSGPGSRQPSESPAPRFPPPSPGMIGPGGPRAVVSNDQMRAASQDARRPDPRLGTSPTPGYRSPSNNAAQRSAGAPPMGAMRSESSGPPQLAQAPSPLRPQSPPRKQWEPQPIDGVTDERRPSPLPTHHANSSGANLFEEARNRLNNYQASPPPPPVQQTPLPKIDTSRAPKSFQNGNAKQPVEPAPHSAVTESSAGIDLEDAAAINALTSYWGAESSTGTGASTPALQETTNPSTPERSRNRPQVATKASQSSFDLRPAPLNQSRQVTEPAARAPPPAVPAPPIEEPPTEVGPLQVPSKPDPQLPVPGAFSPAMFRPSPSADSTPAETPVEEKEEEEMYRPGLGPMFKKRAIADRFKKAATAASTANAFKPRPGGAAERILQAKAERNGAPDGITGVVPRPGQRQAKEERPETPPVSEPVVEQIPKEEPPPIVEVSSPQTPAQPDVPPVPGLRKSVELVDDTSHLKPEVVETPPADLEEKTDYQQYRQPQTKIKRRSAQHERYLADLGIDRSLLEGKGIEFEFMLSEFGWNHEILSPKQLAALENDIRREQGRVEAGSWLSHTDAAREERVAHVEDLLDKAIAECDELEGLLTLYNVELSTLNEDIAFIEAQSQGLQVQSANQKLLQTELQGLVDTMSLDRRVLEPIRHGDLSDARSLAEVEASLVRLYQAMIMMDPSRTSRPRSRGGLDDTETSSMAALRKKKATYDAETNEFCKRFVQFLDTRFTVSMNNAKSRILRVPNSGGLARLHADAFTEARGYLWMYSPIILFTKELNPPAWQTMLRMYNKRAAILYGDAFKENIANWKRAARATSHEEQEILFTSQEKEDPTSTGGLTSTARKLTVKRSQTLAKSFRSSDKQAAPEHRMPGAMMRSQAFAGALDEMAPLMSREQNFFVDLFHAHSLDSEEFVDSVQSLPPDRRRGTNLIDRKPTDPDRAMAGQVSSTMSEIFTSFSREIDLMLNWSVSEDPIQGVGVMASLSRHGFYLQENSQEYLLQLVREMSDKLQSRFTKFVEDQIRAIEDTKVKIKKRKGVIAFMKIFPQFSAAVENVFASVAGNDYEGPAECMFEVRRLVDDAYDRINRAMFDSLKVIAKESPVAGVPSAKQAPIGDDPEDKEMLNYHILLIENMNHYVEEVDDMGRQGVLSQWRERATTERTEALDGYVSRVIRRPLGKLLDFLESAESILSTNTSPTAVSSRPSFSRKAMRTLLSQHDSKEIRRGIDTLRKRIEKHFGEADDEHLSRQLVGFVCKECERAYERALERTEKLVREVYPVTEGEKNVEVPFDKGDVQGGFRR